MQPLTIVYPVIAKNSTPTNTRSAVYLRGERAVGAASASPVGSGVAVGGAESVTRDGSLSSALKAVFQLLRRGVPIGQGSTPGRLSSVAMRGNSRERPVSPRRFDIVR